MYDFTSRNILSISTQLNILQPNPDDMTSPTQMTTPRVLVLLLIPLPL